MVAVAGTEDFVHHHDGRERAELRVAILRVDREMVLDVLELGGIFLELGGFVGVLDGDERFETGFVVEPAVFIDLVGSDSRLDGAVHFHPGDVALVVIVGEKRVRARAEEFLESRIGGGVRGFAQQFRGRKQLSLIFKTVRDNLKTLCVGSAFDDREKSFGVALVLL